MKNIWQNGKVWLFVVAVMAAIVLHFEPGWAEGYWNMNHNVFLQKSTQQEQSSANDSTTSLATTSPGDDQENDLPLELRELFKEQFPFIEHSFFIPVLSFGAFIGVLLTKATEKIFLDEFIKFAKSTPAWNFYWNRIYQVLVFFGISSQWKKPLEKYQDTLQEKLNKLNTPFMDTDNIHLEMSKVYVPLRMGIEQSIDQEANIQKSRIGELDIYEAMRRQFRRVLVIGEPGSGKSVLLKHIAFTHGDKKKLNIPGEPIPILLELNTLEGADINKEYIISRLEDSLEKFDFSNPKFFVKQKLKEWQLLLLLDGLDEVSTDIRSQVVSAIDELMKSYSKCWVIVTCRTEVYEGQKDKLNEIFKNKILKIQNLSDHQIRKFLEVWKSEIRRRNNGTIKTLIETLRKTPSIKDLARNPLLLTFMAYLYATEDGFIFPKSRTAFYEKATNIFLSERHGEITKALNFYQPSEKRDVLCGLSQVFQGIRNSENPNRKSISSAVIGVETGRILATLNMDDDDDDIERVLQEIRERSGLLKRISGDNVYQFSHLTLQEFFAALSLKEKPSELINKIHEDRATWKEVVRFWCGLEVNSTELIRDIYYQPESVHEAHYEHDQLLVFTCLAEIHKIEIELEKDIIENLKIQLRKAATEENFAEAFGALGALVSLSETEDDSIVEPSVTAASKLRGDIVFSFLEDNLLNALDETVFKATANSLSRTNLPRAASLLKTQYVKAEDKNQEVSKKIIKDALVSMGDIAVPSLKSIALEGKDINAINLIFDICTPRAASTLARIFLQRDQDQEIADIAAWRLASLIKNDYILEELESRKILKNEWISSSLKQLAYMEFHWIWQPLLETSPLEERESLSILLEQLIQRILRSLDSSGFILEKPGIVDLENSMFVDPRILIPICACYEKPPLSLKTTITQENIEEIDNLLSQVDNPNSIQEQLNLAQNLLSQISKNTQSNWCKLIQMLHPKYQLELLKRLTQCDDTLPLREQYWQDFRKCAIDEFRFSASGSYKVILGVAIVASFAAILQLLTWQTVTQTFSESFLSPLDELGISPLLVTCISAALGIFSILFFWLTFLYNPRKSIELQIFQKSDPQTFYKLGTLGILTFGKQLQRLRSNLRLRKIVKLPHAVLNSGAIGWITLLGAAITGIETALNFSGVASNLNSGTSSTALIGIMLLTLTWAVPVVATNSGQTESKLTILLRTVIVAILVPVVVVWLGTTIESITITLITSVITSLGALLMGGMMLANRTNSSTFILVAATTMVTALLSIGAISDQAIIAVAITAVLGVVLGNGSAALNNAADDAPAQLSIGQKLLVFCTFPFFCWLPITLGGASWGLHNLLRPLTLPLNSLQLIIIVDLVMLCGCLALWHLGQERERKARNPLQDILPQHRHSQYSQ